MSGFLPVIGSVLWIALSIINGFGAKNRKRSFVGYLLMSLLFSPVFGAYVLIILGEKKDKIKDDISLSNEGGKKQNSKVYTENTITNKEEIKKTKKENDGIML